MTDAIFSANEKVVMALQVDSVAVATTDAVRCGTCGEMRCLFVNRDGQTRCSACDSKYLNGKAVAN